MPDLDAVIEAVTADMFAAACGTPLAPSTVLGWRERLLAARDDYDRAARVATGTVQSDKPFEWTCPECGTLVTTIVRLNSTVNVSVGDKS